MTTSQNTVSWITGPRFIAATFVVMVPVFFLMGLRQRRDAGGTWRRLLGIALALAVLQMLPVVAAFLLLRWRPTFYYRLGLPFVTSLVFGINVLRHRSYLFALKWKQARGAPPRLEDPVVLGRIAEIAGHMGIAPPVTRLVRSSTALQTNNALVSGLVAPTMVLFDGILYRLTEEERDAIIAHELAHLANHTFWYWVVAGAVCSVAVVVASVFYSGSVALGLGVALWIGLWLILSRRLELDCDRRAARVIGHRRAASALWKIHADQPFRGVVEFLIGAVSTHPSRDQRFAAIRLDAPDDDRPEVEWNAAAAGPSSPGRLVCRRVVAGGHRRLPAVGVSFAAIELARAAAVSDGGGTVRVVLAGVSQDSSQPPSPPAEAVRVAAAAGLAGGALAGGLHRRA